MVLRSSSIADPHVECRAEIERLRVIAKAAQAVADEAADAYAPGQWDGYFKTPTKLMATLIKLLGDAKDGYV